MANIQKISATGDVLSVTAQCYAVEQLSMIVEQLVIVGRPNSLGTLPIVRRVHNIKQHLSQVQFKHIS